MVETSVYITIIVLVGIVFIMAVIATHQDDSNPKHHNYQYRNPYVPDACFNSTITKEVFNEMVRRAGKKIKRITKLRTEGAKVYGSVQPQSGLADWNFDIDFDDGGRVTGRYSISTDNSDSRIPEVLAERISQQIIDCFNGKWNPYVNYVNKWNEKMTTFEYCPRCGGKNSLTTAKFCMYCGLRFRT